MNTKEVAIFVQTWLQKQGLYKGRIDGIPGPMTQSAIDATGQIPRNWSARRKLVGMLQYITLQYGQQPGPIDGYYGPNTQHAFENTRFIIAQDSPPPIWRPEELGLQESKWPKQYTPAFEQFYGPKGSSLTYAECPYELKIAWNPNQKVWRFLCHEKVKSSIEKVMRAVLDHYGLEQVQELRLDYFGGCYNDRSIRGGTLPSMHSWGIAIDFDPANNQLRWGRDRATFARPAYQAWWEIWEAEGWVSLGRQRNFDWMHVQAASL
ncbi:M15 family metallopeptidase [Belliella pelovolcani]|uniref:D-alanyl-D-alanine carboxypeptidase n=1 Tax=Belliella pelovolcani TaxID=529505 RepID=A0A1N7KQ23_9BACT|nr:M15 family metallopeptidase [Belliella pelovolcani]SIS63520.1 D-alanyl-D-alanine carboxypeptidase [Belliella pelovolcani]